MARERSEQRPLCELHTHSFPLSSGLTSAHPPGSWAGVALCGGQSCVNHTPSHIGPAGGERLTAPDAAVVPDVQVEVPQGRDFSEASVSSDAVPLEPLLGSSLLF